MAKKEEAKKAEAKESAPKEKGKSKLLIIIIALLVLIIVAGAAAFFFLLPAPSDEEIAKEIEKDEAPVAVTYSSETEVGVMWELQPFVVNLADPKAKHFLKASITLELKDDQAKELAQKLLPRIRNDILMLLTSQTLEDVISIEGKVRLKDEITARLNRILGPGKLLNVYFSQFVIQ